MNAISRATLLCALGLSLGACERRGDGVRPPPSAAEVTEDPPAPPAPDPHAAAGSVGGTLLETMDSGGYTYLRIATATGEVWAAVPQAKVMVGDTVAIASPMEMNGFTSETLGRTFDSILFGTLASGGAAATGAPAAGTAALTAPLPRAEGATGRTIAEVFAQKATLADQPVAIRGKVTKFNADIMGKNWLHVQDGTGAAAQQDFDLVVTTSETAAIGDVVVVRGVVRTDKDFGAGYAYAVLVEDATLER